MNNQLIEKVIKSNDVSASPDFTFENPLLNRNVAGALARSFVKILRMSQQDSNVNNNLRHSVLANIRKICRIEPENHLEIDDNFTKSLSEVYLKTIEESQVNDSETLLERSLDEFLIRKMKDVDLKSYYQSSKKPEVVQALVNLTTDSSKLMLITEDVLHWNVSDKKQLAVVKDLWANSCFNEIAPCSIYDDISIKMKSEIELVILDLIHSLLTKPDTNIEDKLKTNKELIQNCSKSCECFQICCRILNCLFINTKFNVDIKHFVSKFIQSVKDNCLNSISFLYPSHLKSIVVLLDIDLDSFPNKLKSKYVDQTLVNLKTLQSNIESDLIMLLSHFPQWFDLYYEDKMTETL